MTNPIRNFTIGLLGERPTPAQRRQLAELLEAEAVYQRQLADAQQREFQKPRERRIGGNGIGGRPSHMTVRLFRVDRRGEADSVNIKVSTATLNAVLAIINFRGDVRFDLQRVSHNEFLLVPAAGGYKLMSNIGGHRLNVSGSRDLLLDVPDGSYRATVDQTGIVHVKID